MLLEKDFFVVGAKAKDKNDYVIYDKAKGILYYDADGSGADTSRWSSPPSPRTSR